MKSLPQKMLFFILLCATALGFILVGYFSTSTKPAAVVVDFNKTISPQIEESVKVLHVAVAAMTSPQRTRRRYHDLLKLIGQELGCRIEFVQRPTYNEVDALLRDNKVDLAFICSGSYALGHDRYNLELLAIPIINGKKTYNSNIIVAQDSPYTSITDLRQQRFAFTSKASNTGYLAPSYLFQTNNISIDSFFSDIIFTHSHDNSVHAVASGLVDAAAVDSLVLDHMLIDNDKDAQNVRVIHTSEDFGIPPIVVPHQLAPKLKQQLQRFFLAAHRSAEGQEILNALRIDYFTMPHDHNYNSIREMARLCNNL